MKAGEFPCHSQQLLWRGPPRDYTNRAIATFNGSVGVGFDTANAGTLVNSGSAYGVTTDLVAYLRGNRTLEGGTYRIRTGLLGADVNAEPVSLATEGVVFATTNEGMVHALAQGTGNELWAYMPGFALGAAGATSQKTWAFQTILDGTPTLGKVNGHFILVGGRGTAGTGFYALDVTHPKGSVDVASATQSDSVVASRVLWEFPSASTPSDVVKSMGASMGKPVIVKTHKYGSVVVLTSGYNTTLDGKGRVFVLDAMTGTLLHTFVTTAGTVGTRAGSTSAEAPGRWLHVQAYQRSNRSRPLSRCTSARNLVPSISSKSYDTTGTMPKPPHHVRDDANIANQHDAIDDSGMMHQVA